MWIWKILLAKIRKSEKKKREKYNKSSVHFYRECDSNEGIVKIGETVVAVSTNQFPGVHWRANSCARISRVGERKKCRRPRQTP